MSILLFQPHIGEQYGNSELGKLLLVGESHYFYQPESDYENFTKKIIGNLGTQNDNNFFIKVGSIFNAENYLAVWPKVAFANAIQHPFTESRATITKEHLQTVEPAIQEYLAITKAKKMIVFSERIWKDGLPGGIKWGKYIETLNDEQYNKSATVWKFENEVGFCYGIGIHHPSSTRPYFNPEEWRPLVNIFLNKYDED